MEIGGYAAGYAGRLFANADFEVVRIEDDLHRPCWVSQQAMDLYLHPGKSRISTSDLDLIGKLSNQADIVILETGGADETESFGFDTWSTPIKVSITPFGRTGPYKNWQATNATLLAMGGYTNLMGDADREPLTLPGHYVDFQGGGFAYSAAASTHLAGENSNIDIGLLEVVMALSQFTTVMWTCAGIVRLRHGNDFWSVVPTTLFRCVDGWVYINIVPGFWDPFTTMLDMPELVLDPRFTTNGLRMENRDAVHEIAAERFALWTRAEILERAETSRVPVGAVLTFGEVLDDPHLAQRNMWNDVRLTDGTPIKCPRLPFVTENRSNRKLELPEIKEYIDG